MGGEVKAINGYPNYTISNNGEVFSIRRNKYLKLFKNRKGYLLVSITNNKKCKHISVHRLVASHFIKNEFNKPQVNHIDGNKCNNNYLNLEWATGSENCKHAHQSGLVKKTEKGKMAQKLACSRIVLDTQTGIFYDSITEVAKVKNIGHTTATRYLKIKNNKYSIIFA